MLVSDETKAALLRLQKKCQWMRQNGEADMRSVLSFIADELSGELDEDDFGDEDDF